MSHTPPKKRKKEKETLIFVTWWNNLKGSMKEYVTVAGRNSGNKKSGLFALCT